MSEEYHLATAFKMDFDEVANARLWGKTSTQLQSIEMRNDARVT